MRQGKASAVFGAVVVLSLIGGGCATKKHVREAIAPVQNQVNDVEKQTKENHQAIGDLDRQVATADEKATDAGKRAGEAAEAANNANKAALQAGQQADAASSLARQVGQQAQDGISKLDGTMQTSFQNLDNYKLVSTEHVYFRLGASALSKEDQEKLDGALQNVTNMRNYLIEVEGFADRTGDKAYNRELSRKRADAVVHYLAVEHNVPLRGIRQIGAGSDFPDADNSNRAARKENRRVDVKIYALDLKGNTQALNSSSSGRPNSASNAESTQAPPQP